MTPDALDRASVTGAQREILTRVAAAPFASAVYLTGGTALAGFYLHHRVSDDLDLFSDDEVPLLAIESFLRCVPYTSIASYQRLYDRKVFLLHVGADRLKVEFTRYPFPRVTPLARVHAGPAIDSPIEIYVNKLAACVDRNEPKDDVDLYFLLHAAGMPPLRDAAALAERKFGLKGLRYSVQRRLLAVPTALPPTTPPVTRDDVATTFRTEVERLVSSTLAGDTGDTGAGS